MSNSQADKASTEAEQLSLKSQNIQEPTRQMQQIGQLKLRAFDFYARH